MLTWRTGGRTPKFSVDVEDRGRTPKFSVDVEDREEDSKVQC